MYGMTAICFDCLCMRQAIRREGFRKRRAALGLPPGDTDPYFDTMNDDEWQVCLRSSALCAQLQRHSLWLPHLLSPISCQDGWQDK